MGLNPNQRRNDRDPRQWADESLLVIEDARVVRVRSHTQGDDVGHAVEVTADRFDEPVVADIAVAQHGDVAIPSRGDRVLIAHRFDARPIILAGQYNGEPVPDFEPGERVVGHPASDSFIRLAADGSVTIESAPVELDSTTTIELTADGDVVIDGGNTQPVTDVDFTNETVSRSSNVYVP